MIAKVFAAVSPDPSLQPTRYGLRLTHAAERKR